MSEMRLWKAKIKEFFHRDIMSTVWVHSGTAGTKGLVVVEGPWAVTISDAAATTVSPFETPSNIVGGDYQHREAFLQSLVIV